MKQLLLSKIKNRFTWIIFAIVIVCGLFLTNVSVNIGYSNVSGDGLAVLYYETGSSHLFSEDCTVVESITAIDGYAESSLKWRSLKFDRFRIDTNNVESYKIDSINIKLGPISALFIEGADISECIESTNDVEINAVDNGICINVIGSDPYIIFSYNSPMAMIAYAGLLLLLILAGVVAIVIIYLVVALYNRNKERFIKITKIAFFIAIAIFIILTDVSTIRIIREDKTDSYMIQTHEYGLITVQQDNIEFDFINHGKSLTSVDIFREGTDEVSGSLECTISKLGLDEIVSSDVYDIKNVMVSDEIIIPVDTALFERGEKYHVVCSFNIDKPINLLKNTDGNLRYKQVFDNIYRPLYISFVFSANAIIVIFIWLVIKNGPRNILIAIFGIIIGIIATFVITPCSMDDEYRHFARAHQISMGHVFATTAEEIPDDMTGIVATSSMGRYYVDDFPMEVDDIKFLDHDHNFKNQTYFSEVNNRLSITEWVYQLTRPVSGETKTVSVAATVGLSVFSYLPQVIFMVIGRLLGCTPFVLFYLGRIGNVCVCMLLAWLSARLAPKYKWVIWATVFIPRITALRSSCSTDGFLVAMVVLFIAYILYLKDNKKHWISPKYLVPLLIISSYVAILKLPYVLIALSILLLTKENYRFVKKRALVLITGLLLTGCVGLVSFGVYKAVNIVNSTNIDKTVSVVYVEDDTTTYEATSLTDNYRIRYILDEPVEWSKMILGEYKSLVKNGVEIITGYFCYPMVYVLMLLSLLLIKRNMKYLEKLYLLIIAAIMWFSVLMVFYMMSEPGTGQIIGLGQRYLLPILPAVFVAFPIGNEKTEKVVNYALPFMIIAFVGMNSYRIVSLFI